MQCQRDLHLEASQFTFMGCTFTYYDHFVGLLLIIHHNHVIIHLNPLQEIEGDGD